MLSKEEWLRAMMKACIRYLLIGLLWQFLEFHFYGQVQPRIVDDIIGLFLFYYITKREEEKAMAKRKKVNPFGMNSSLQDAVQVMKQLPVSAILASMEMQIDTLAERGIEIRDWENKDRVLKQVRIMGGKAYFLADTKEDNGESMD